MPVRSAARRRPFRRSLVKLAVLDLDGTLTRTSAVDARCYVQACSEVLGAVADPDWAVYRHCTDSAILTELAERALGRPETQQERIAVQQRLVELLEASRGEADYTLVPGAAEMLSALERHGWVAVIATGAWRASALVKIARAGLVVDGIPLIASDAFVTREEIVTAAIDAARVTYGGDFERIVSVGDGVWDVRTAANLGLPFVGVAAEGNRQRLEAAGASVIFESYRDLDRFLAALDRAP
jgi:phosphoglycolate phosphatase-like HAD superfamily hydrolase